MHASARRLEGSPLQLANLGRLRPREIAACGGRIPEDGSSLSVSTRSRAADPGSDVPPDIGDGASLLDTIDADLGDCCEDDASERESWCVFRNLQAGLSLSTTAFSLAAMAL